MDISLTKGLCEQLAKELLKEEAEVLKHEAAIKNIKQIIVEKKKELIKDYIDFCHYNIKGMESEIVYFKLSPENTNADYMVLDAYLAALPSSIPSNIEMTPAETRMIEKYKKAFSKYHKDRTDENGCKIVKLARALFSLKHGIDLFHHCHNIIDFDEIANTEFFDHTDIKILDRFGHIVNIEDYND